MRAGGVAVLAVLALLAVAARPAPGATPVELARPADAFADSIGVNVHSSYLDTAYADRARLMEALEWLGVRHVRDAVQANPDPGSKSLNQRQYALLNALARRGIGATLIAGRPRTEGQGLRSALAAVRLELPRAVEALEGPNEYDVSGDRSWVRTLRAFQRRLFRLVKSDPALRRLTVLGPSLARFSSRARLGDLSRWLDQGSIHPYPGGKQPSKKHLKAELALGAVTSSRKTLVATETGYSNALGARRDGSEQPPVSEAAAAVYLPRLLLEHARSGISRTFVYELFDQKPDPWQTDQEKHWGLFRYDGSPKPAAMAVRSLLELTSDRGSSFRPGGLAVAVDGGGKNLRRLLLQRRDGTFLLFLWRELPVWDELRRVAMAPPLTSVTLRFGQPVQRASVFRVGEDEPPERTGVERPGQVTVPVGAVPIVVRILPARSDHRSPPQRWSAAERTR